MQTSDIIEFIKICSKEDLYAIRRASQYRINDMNKSEVKALSRASDWSVSVATELAHLGKRNYPFVGNHNLFDWAEDIDKLNRIDKQDKQLIEDVMRWSQTDDFWKRQIRSGNALRRHFEKLLIGKSKPLDGPAGYYCPKHPTNFISKGKVCGYC